MIKYGCFYFLDLIAIPDFASGAMENWGLITCSETSLLFDPRTSSMSDKLWVTKVIAHELAHQVPGSHGILLGSVPKSIMQNTPVFPKQCKIMSFYFQGAPWDHQTNTVCQVAEGSTSRLWVSYENFITGELATMSSKTFQGTKPPNVF